MGCASSSEAPVSQRKAEPESGPSTAHQAEAPFVESQAAHDEQESQLSTTSGLAAPFQGSTSASTTSTTKTLLQRQIENDRRRQQNASNSQSRGYNHYSSLPIGLPTPPRHKKYTPFQRPEYFFLESLTEQISKENAMREDKYSLQLSKLSWSLREAQKEDSLSRVSSMDPASPHSPPRVVTRSHVDQKLDPFLGFSVAATNAPLSSNEVPIIVPSPHRLSNRTGLVRDQEDNDSNYPVASTSRTNLHDKSSNSLPHETVKGGMSSHHVMVGPAIPGQVM